EITVAFLMIRTEAIPISIVSAIISQHGLAIGKIADNSHSPNHKRDSVIDQKSDQFAIIVTSIEHIGALAAEC
ncbi:MAG: hypothetical protein LHW46_03530, partial [Candidatus Cloacimonetes bacterium]|nr:hypothetical protein [Candidatus Cloacimonadota bacterium]